MESTWTPAHQAVEDEDAEALALIVANGVDPDEVCHSMTLLTHAVDVEGDGALHNGSPLSVHTAAVLLAMAAVRAGTGLPERCDGVGPVRAG
ncbi:ankyrin repeat domain-containing protein [Streptomyces sp. Qhu-G9]|uniref:ankyrin repeat domain-containing protein n=1 Tax=Streptomyces sp. Qhu-G9 TaxID=3452799 RepID=UPI0022AC0D90|nr:ankyrin repeat domain-containing protein [Streptomyces aurantiacus]WAU86402.1 ankyrin repeat domain-containing protein [Streptomyces aurantiacus]